MPKPGSSSLRHDDAAAAAENLDVGGAALAQQIHQVAEELVVSALIGAYRDGLRVFLDGSVDDLENRAIVTEMDDFDASGLEKPANDIDGSVVAVEQRSGGDESDRVAECVDGIRGRH